MEASPPRGSRSFSFGMFSVLENILFSGLKEMRISQGFAPSPAALIILSPHPHPLPVFLTESVRHLLNWNIKDLRLPAFPISSSLPRQQFGVTFSSTSSVVVVVVVVVVAEAETIKNKKEREGEGGGGDRRHSCAVLVVEAASFPRGSKKCMYYTHSHEMTVVNTEGKKR